MLELNKIYNMDCLEGLKQLPDNSINCCVTSPPYWGLRDYRVEGQLGLESTPEEYVTKMVEIFREVKRVLKKEGTLWLNLGDSYAMKFGGGKGRKSRTTKATVDEIEKPPREIPSGLKPKDLVGIPWMVAFALRADGWYLRQDIIWHKPNVMPESVKDRPTKAHEYIFLLSKSSKYYYDAEAIKEPLAKPEELLRKTPAVFGGRNKHDGYGTKKYSGNKYVGTYTGRNKRSVWTIPTKPFKEAHFAVFPPDLIKPCILAGTSPHACEICGAPWERVVERISLNKQNIGGKLADIKKTGFRNDGNIRMGYAATKTLGWQPTCTCQNEGKGRCIVLDPFMGSGTTALVAKRLNRNYIGIDINPEYCKMAQERLQGITYKDKQLMEQGQLTLELKI